MPTGIFNNTAIRMAIRYSFIYGAILIAFVVAFNWALQSPVDGKIKSALFKERDIVRQVFQESGLDGLRAFIKKQAKKPEPYIYLLVDRNGNKLAGNLQQKPDDYHSLAIKTGKVSYLDYSEQNLPVVQFKDEAYLPSTLTAFTDGSQLLIAHPEQRAYILREIYEFLLETAIPVILLSLLIGLTLAFTVLRRINTINETAKEIMEGDITQRIPLSGKHDEFDALSTQLNAMMDRIQKLIENIREVSDNVAHDLRSPLTRLRNNFEVTLLEERNSEEYRETLNNGIQDVEALLKTFNSLLSIAQAESGNHRYRWKKITLSKLLADMVELYEPLAAEKKQHLKLLQNGQLEMTANRDLLAQAISNLIENAIKYTPERGEIRVGLDADNHTISITISDSGPGIPEKEREHVLERFVRLDNSRHTEGNGLGLSLVKAVCELHHGTLHFSDANPGLKVMMKFPVKGKEK